MDRIRERGSVTQVIKGNKFEVALQDHPTHKVIAHLCGRMRKAKIVPILGDAVAIELSPYDLHKGRVVWLYKEK